MSEVCSCNEFTLGNMGVPGCVDPASETRRLILAQWLKFNGSIQAIPTATTINAAFWNSHIQRYDDSGTLVAQDARWYLSPDLINVADTRGDTVFFESQAGDKYQVRKGTRSFVAMIPNGTPELLKEIKKFGCVDLGCLYVDASDNVIGSGKSTADGLRFIRINRNSFDAQLVKANGGNAPQMISIAFDIDAREYDSDLKMIKASDMTVVPSDLNPLWDVLGTISSVSTTGFVLTTRTNFAPFLGTSPVPGLVKADFVLEELSPTPSTITITSVTESTTTPGVYTFVIPTQTSADELKLTLKKVGLDGEALESLAITIP